MRSWLSVFCLLAAAAAAAASADVCRTLNPQTILSVVWDRRGEELLPWGGLVALGSFNQVMSSELFRPAWVSQGSEGARERSSRTYVRFAEERRPKIDASTPPPV